MIRKPRLSAITRADSHSQSTMTFILMTFAGDCILLDYPPRAPAACGASEIGPASVVWAAGAGQIGSFGIMFVKSYALGFEGYWCAPGISGLPAVSGIYGVSAAAFDARAQTV